jgi:hypothetical protein
VIGIVGGTVTASARKFGHSLSLGITALMLVLLTAYIAWSSKKRFGTTWQKYGPLILMPIASAMIIADPIRHVLQDADVWPARNGDHYVGSAQYLRGCAHETMSCLSPIGIVFTIVLTYVGFFILFVGMLWNAHICDKLKEIKAKWRQLRNPQATKKRRRRRKKIVVADDDDETDSVHLGDSNGDGLLTSDVMV